MEKNNGNEPRDRESERDSASKDHPAPVPDSTANKTPKKRRKVNHACVYCRRSHMTCDLDRPCMRCIKRNIGHLCHDEPRDTESKKSKSVMGASTVDESESHSEIRRPSGDQKSSAMGPPSFDGGINVGPGQVAKSPFEANTLSKTNALPLVQPRPVPSIQGAALNSNLNEFTGFPDALLSAQNHYHDMHSYHSNYMIVPEVTNEFNLLNDFLHSSLLDDAALLPDGQNELLENQSTAVSTFLNNGHTSGDSMDSTSSAHGNDGLLPQAAMQGAGGSLAPFSSGNAEHGKAIGRPSSVIPVDKAREYYLQAADPSGNDTPEERMQRVLKAKYDAGLLKPFNYIKGYARLSAYLETHVAPSSRQKVLRQLDRFRPKFREKSQALTDMDLVFVEMWFEKTLLEYDRVFASMAVPACCWRRTGEIFRGNKEMAELINVPVERLRGGKIALHEILTEESVVRYWEEFGTIAFDPAHDTLLTACSLKNPDDDSNSPVVKCCFSFMIRRDEHKIPCLIVGNFLPHDPDETKDAK
ncbi:hypothetical protein VTK73DRAFT_5910 [Phialemonium thermophilum]|uniref:Zn(2)-C6 fungal-type domain-containing protein n=1 Tax=Phialemonium thermophilum TaxID=223376 RepID=A0ABR3WLQ6_9PEZI